MAFTKYTDKWNLSEVIPYLLKYYFNNKPTSNNDLRQAFWRLMGKNIRFYEGGLLRWTDGKRGVPMQIHALSKRDKLNIVDDSGDVIEYNQDKFSYQTGKNAGTVISEFESKYGKEVIDYEINKFLSDTVKQPENLKNFPQSKVERKSIQEKVRFAIERAPCPIGLESLMSKSGSNKRTTVQSYANKMVTDGVAIKIKPKNPKSKKFLYINNTDTNRIRYERRTFEKHSKNLKTKTVVLLEKTDNKSKEHTPEISVKFDFPEGLAYVGKEARIFVRLENIGKKGVEDINLKARFTGALGVDQDSLSLDFLAPRNHVQFYWTIRPNRAGRFSIYKPTLKFMIIGGKKQKQELDSIDVEVKPAPKSQRHLLRRFM
ncbi:hypothetical protein BMS3Abin16_00473 [archaeon BMS3Abin16]|nr:hypothetical protein BMS3Abin16_00473 [archaeon BMS3Abin16]